MTTFEQSDRPAGGQRLIAWLVASAYFMELLDGTVISTALPKIAESFHRNPVDLSIGMSAYMLTLGVFIPISGWVADRFGTRSVFGSAIALFTLSSILCGFSVGLWSFTASRVLQGIGGAMMVPVGRLVVLRTTAKKDLLPVLAMIVWPGLLAPVLGPGVGGFFATYLTWRWIFFLNAPLGLIAIALNFLFVPNLHAEARRRLDVAGFGLSGVAVVAFVYGLDSLGEGHGSAWKALALLLLGIGVGAWSLLHFRRVADPLIDFHAMKLKTFGAFAVGGSLFRIAFGTTSFLLPLMFQVGFGLKAFESGLLIMTIFVGNIVIKPATIPLLRIIGFKKILVWNGVLVAASHAVCGLFTPSTPHLVIEIVLFFAGACRSLQFTALNTLQFAEVAQPKMSGANTLSSMISQITMGVGIAVGAVTIDMCAWARGGAAGSLALADFRNAFFLIGAVSLLSTFDYVGLAKDAGNAVARRGKPDGGERSKAPAEEERA
jgi:EmrB/QacA subfamily drug resistance transporter